METDWRPALAPAVLLRRDGVTGADLLVMPERVVVLNEQAGAVLRLCDGASTVTQIVDRLLADHPGAPVAEEVPVFIDRVRGEGWVR
ncbi:pyrroloquinoline quinone biosynthesis peptide chaperone PqqD [Rhizohabitans arisaemae]|uniref:pyrroloquinoline quinone biosynthesis peptide chaperone PqqD n=1 Tax=Rhizohabitans arisaemae TaxID=2720610 RepID=UPI0024B14345|nr:pyrroloquinoline quinone biosynthesis peptide chaperone PqqD [Rhizohabitans arisaemae]